MIARLAIAIVLVTGAPVGATSTVDTASPVMRANTGQFRACYLRELARKPGLHGNVALRFTIGRDGRVAAAIVRETTLNDELVESCMISHLKTLKFPASDDSKEVEFGFVFVSRGR